MKFLPLLVAAILAPAAAQAFSLTPKEIPPSYATKECHQFKSGSKTSRIIQLLCIPYNGEEPYTITGFRNPATGEVATITE